MNSIIIEPFKLRKNIKADKLVTSELAPGCVHSIKRRKLTFEKEMCFPNIIASTKT